MSKRFKNKVCVYCCGIATTADHVVARQFFPEHARGNLPKVPACSRCNKAKSDLEHYLVTVLPAGGNHPSAIAALDKLPIRLASNRRLARELGAGYRELPDGRGVISVRADFIDGYIKYIAKGLVYDQLNQIVDDRFQVDGSALRLGGAEALERMHEHYGEDLLRISGSYADGAFEFVGHIARQHSPVSVWQIRLYGRVAMEGAHEGLPAAAYEFGAAIFLKRKHRPANGASQGHAISASSSM